MFRYKSFIWSNDMKVKLLVSRAGVNFSQNAGEIIDVSNDEALNLVKEGQAELAQVKETATKKRTTRKAVKS